VDIGILFQLTRFSLNGTLQNLKTIKIESGGPVHFVIGSDDGSKLYIDGNLRIDNWTGWAYHIKGITIDMHAWHTLIKRALKHKTEEELSEKKPLAIEVMAR